MKLIYDSDRPVLERFFRIDGDGNEIFIPCYMITFDDGDQFYSVERWGNEEKRKKMIAWFRDAL